MWKYFHNILQPWQTAPGWQFELLRALPPHEADRLYHRALDRQRRTLRRDWRWWVIMVFFCGFTQFSLLAGWLIAGALGFGPMGKLVLDLGFHLIFGPFFLHRMISNRQQRHLLDALTLELLRLAKDELESRAASVPAYRFQQIAT